MRRVILLCAVALFAITPIVNHASAQEDRAFTFGFRTGYYFGAKAYVLGIYGTYGLADWLNIEPGINYIPKQNSSIDVYCDFQVPLSIASYWHIFPIVGISANHISEQSGTVVGWSAGLNLGLGTKYNFGGNWDVNLQCKWMGRIPTKFSNAVILNIGVGYTF